VTIEDILVGVGVTIVGLVLWTMFTFIAIDQEDRLMWRAAPVLSGAVSASVYSIVGTLSESLVVGAMVTAVLLVLDRLLLGSFDEVRATYLSE
jgi:hypothetical protein